MTEQLTEPHLVPAEVREFVARVREHLRDLDAEEQQELTADLEADLTDLVGEQGPGALRDPAAYARELRVAAGHSPVMAPTAQGRGLRAATMDAIDSTHASWDRLLDALPGDARGFLTSLQPVWWVLRAGIAWVVAQEVRQPVILTTGPWLVVLGVFVVVSVQLGRGAWGVRALLGRSVAVRLTLVALNVFAACMAYGAADSVAWHVAEQRAWQFDYADTSTQEPSSWTSIVYRGRQVCDLEVRTRQGEVLTKARVWDLTSDRPLPMTTDAC